MAKFVELMFTSLGVIIDAESALTPATYTPAVNGRLTKVLINPGAIAATTLIESGYVRLRCTTFGGVDMVAPFAGAGLETVPRAEKKLWVTECDLAVKAGVPITGLYYYNVAPTTPELFVFGEFEA